MYENAVEERTGVILEHASNIQKWYQSILLKRVTESLKRNKSDTVIVPTAEAAREYLLKNISIEATVGYGNSMSLHQIKNTRGIGS